MRREITAALKRIEVGREMLGDVDTIINYAGSAEGLVWIQANCAELRPDQTPQSSDNKGITILRQRLYLEKPVVHDHHRVLGGYRRGCLERAWNDQITWIVPLPPAFLPLHRAVLDAAADIDYCHNPAVGHPAGQQGPYISSSATSWTSANDHSTKLRDARVIIFRDLVIGQLAKLELFITKFQSCDHLANVVRLRDAIKEFLGALLKHDSESESDLVVMGRSLLTQAQAKSGEKRRYSDGEGDSSRKRRRMPGEIDL